MNNTTFHPGTKGDAACFTRLQNPYGLRVFEARRIQMGYIALVVSRSPKWREIKWAI